MMKNIINNQWFAWSVLIFGFFVSSLSMITIPLFIFLIWKNSHMIRPIRVIVTCVAIIILMANLVGGIDTGETNDQPKIETPTPMEEKVPNADSEPIAEEAPKPEEVKPEPEPKPEPTPEIVEKEPEMTLAQKNAIRAAKNYLDYTSFSKKGLIKQLEFEEYSTEDAKFAVNNIEVDWKFQAVEAGKKYLDYSAFSRSGLIKQLEFEGFTTEEATHAVNEIGL